MDLREFKGRCNFKNKVWLNYYLLFSLCIGYFLNLWIGIFGSFDDHPSRQLVSQTETILKFMSYVIAGKMKSSAISEFLYSTINIIVLINDEILVSALKLAETRQRPEVIFSDQQWRPIRIFFTVIDNLSVFLELYTTKCWGMLLIFPSLLLFYFFLIVIILNKHRCTGKMDGHNHFTGSQVGHQASTVIVHT